MCVANFHEITGPEMSSLTEYIVDTNLLMYVSMYRAANKETPCITIRDVLTYIVHKLLYVPKHKRTRNETLFRTRFTCR